MNYIYIYIYIYKAFSIFLYFLPIWVAWDPGQCWLAVVERRGEAAYWGWYRSYGAEMGLCCNSGSWCDGSAAWVTTGSPPKPISVMKEKAEGSWWIYTNKQNLENLWVQGCGEKGTLVHCCWECKLGQPLWQTVRRILEKSELPYDPAISLLVIFPKKTETLIWKDRRTPMFTEALFTIAKTWKQSKCPSTDANGWSRCGIYMQWNITQS